MDMDQMIKSFPNQISEQHEALKDLSFNLDNFLNIDNIVIAGMGGSAISGDIIKLLLRDDIKYPINIIRDYNCSMLYKSNSTLFIISSYSGNTEEALSMYEVARKCSKKIICVTTGGKLKELADRDSINTVSITKGFQPRAALGYSLMALMMILNKLKLVPDSYVNSMIESIPKLELFYEDHCKKDQYAHKFAEKIYGGLIMIYGTALTDPIVSRFRAQIAENAKLLSSHHILPELNHNEIVGFETNPFPNIPRRVVWISDPEDHKQVLKRMKITFKLFEDMKIENFYINIINSDKDNFITRSLKLIYITDWISYYLSDFNNVDPIPVDTIKKLKDKMSEGNK
tara:strand:- start:145 stop:1173 length:1029 start_codon:yes stop_codon:yes gene_type:complete